MPRHHRLPALTLALTAALVLSACTAADDPDTGPGEPPRTTAAPADEPRPTGPVPEGLEDYYAQELVWEDCDGDFQCAEAEVPLDYADPDGERITLALQRRTTGDEARVGSLLLNPGGPGGSGIQMLASAELLFSQDLVRHYDLVGFDPRGVGRSAAVDCLTDAELDEWRATNHDLETDAGLRAAQAAAERMGTQCAEKTGELLAHVDTDSAARDLDVLRHLLEDDRLHYLGYSYGTMLGAVYADLFPDRVGRLVLDGGLDPSLDAQELAEGQAVGFENALRDYAEDCLTGSDCPLSGDADDAVGQVQRLLEVAESTPLPTSTDRELTGPLAFSGIVLPLYEDALWPLLSEALRQAMTENDGSQLLYLADLSADRRPDGTYATNSQEAFTAIHCLDYPVQGDLPQWKQRATELEERAPTFGPALAYSQLQCDRWPHPAVGERRPVEAAGAEPILVVGTTGDPATPYAWSESLAEQLSSGHLLTYDGPGHTAYGRANACVTDAVDAYLIEGRVPEEGRTC